MNVAEFLDNSVPVPVISDAYTISSEFFASGSARKKSVYNLTNRISPAKGMPSVAKDSRMVFFGLSDYIRTYLTRRVTYNDILLTEQFMNRAGSFGTHLPFPKEMWMRVLSEYNGYMPITIEGLEEGSTFFPNEPMVQVTSFDKGFGELAAHIEPLIVGMVSIATARATLTRHWREKIKEAIINDGADSVEAITGVLMWMIHDFGMRAHFCELESRVLGKAHLLSFNGTDTFNAAYSVWKNYGAKDEGVGTSILALAHRNVQGYEQYEELGEYMSFRAINEAARQCGNIASYVSDCYSFRKALDKCADIAVGTGSTVVCRPDSGDAIENIVAVVEKALNLGLVKNGRATRLRFIEGNSVTPEVVDRAFAALKELGVEIDGWGIFGVGGYLRNSCTRDTLSSAYKLAAIGTNEYGVCKLSEDEVKMSIPGRVYLTTPTVDNQTSVWSTPQKENRLKVYYTPGNFDHDNLLEDFVHKRNRALNDFNKYDALMKVNPNFGVRCEHLDKNIQNIRRTTANKYRDTNFEMVK